jgi:hypothetical protein
MTVMIGTEGGMFSLGSFSFFNILLLIAIPASSRVAIIFLVGWFSPNLPNIRLPFCRENLKSPDKGQVNFLYYYTMDKRKFFSMKYQKYILPG